MPRFLEKKMEKRYGKGNPIIYATMNKMGMMKGNKTTSKGMELEKKHQLNALKRKLK